MDLCNLDHGFSWLHKKEHCEFIQRLSVQKKNLINFPIDKFPGQIIDCESFLPTLIPTLFQKVLSHRRYPSHKDILKVSQRIIKKIQSVSGPKKNWNSEQIVILFWVSQYFQRILDKEIHTFSQNNIPQFVEIWDRISDFVPGRTGRQCMFKYLKIKRVSISQCPWTEKQQLLLSKLVSQSPMIDWNWVSQELFFAAEEGSIYRFPKQCRQHWSSYSNSRFKKGAWNSDEDIVLLSNILKIGRKWSELSKLLPGRTQNAIKNRANLLLNKDTRKFKVTSVNPSILELIQSVKTNNVSLVIPSAVGSTSFDIPPKNSTINFTKIDLFKPETLSWGEFSDLNEAMKDPSQQTFYSFQSPYSQACAAYNPQKSNKQLQLGISGNSPVEDYEKESPLQTVLEFQRMNSYSFDEMFCQNYLEMEELGFSEREAGDELEDFFQR